MFYKCINITKVCIKHKKKGFIINNNNNNIKILKSLLKINIIKFMVIKNNKIIAHINYHNNAPIFNNIINLFKPSNKKYISLKNLKKITEKHNWILILSTNKGLINSYEALRLKIGGLVIAKIWN